MNLIAGTLHREGEQWTICNGANKWPVSNRWMLDDENDGQSVLLGIRPADIRMSEKGEGVEAQVRVVEMTGDMTLIHLDCLGRKIHLQHAGRLFVKTGDTVHLTFDPELAHIFDAESTSRLKESKSCTMRQHLPLNR